MATQETSLMDVIAATPALCKIAQCLTIAEANALAKASRKLYELQPAILAAAQPNTRSAMAEKTPEHLRIPITMGLRRTRVVNGVFGAVCARGHLELATWMATHYALTREEKLAKENDVINSICAGNDVQMAQWYVGSCKLRQKEALEMFQQACMYGNLEMSQWLAARFSLTREVVRAGWLFRRTCLWLRPAINKWLVEYFDLSREEVMAEDNLAFQAICSFGYLDLAKWIAARYNFTHADVTNGGNCAYIAAVQNSHHAVAEWLKAYAE